VNKDFQNAIILLSSVQWRIYDFRKGSRVEAPRGVDVGGVSPTCVKGSPPRAGGGLPSPLGVRSGDGALPLPQKILQFSE